MREFVFLSDGGFSVEGEGHRYRPWGFDGGLDGQPAKLTYRRARRRHGRTPLQNALTAAREFHRVTSSAPEIKRNTSVSVRNAASLTRR